MDAHDVLVQINEILLATSISERESFLMIDDLVAEYFAQFKENLENEEDE